MIKDPIILQALRDEWKGLRATQQSIKNTLSGYKRLTGGVYFNYFENLVYSLVLPLAFSVLEHTLMQLRDEGVFKCKSNSLKHLMKASQPTLPWLDFALVDEARDKRNKFVHEQKEIERVDTWKYVDAIEAELVEWKVLLAQIQMY